MGKGPTDLSNSGSILWASLARPCILGCPLLCPPCHFIPLVSTERDFLLSWCPICVPHPRRSPPPRKSQRMLMGVGRVSWGDMNP